MLLRMLLRERRPLRLRRKTSSALKRLAEAEGHFNKLRMAHSGAKLVDTNQEAELRGRLHACGGQSLHQVAAVVAQAYCGGSSSDTAVVSAALVAVAVCPWGRAALVAVCLWGRAALVAVYPGAGQH